jgi:hypothetical protein
MSGHTEVLATIPTEYAGIVTVIAQGADDLLRLEEALADTKMTRDEIVSSCENADLVAQYEAAQEYARELFAAIRQEVTGESSDRADLIAEGKKIYDTVKAALNFLEKVYRPGVTNDVLAVLPKPEGVGIRSHIRSLDPNYVPQKRIK